MLRTDPFQEPWYELDFHMTRWRCPTGLPDDLLEDVIEALRDVDGLQLAAVRLVNEYSYGWDESVKRYIPESAYESFRGEFEQLEDRFNLARIELAHRWASIETTYNLQIDGLLDATRLGLKAPQSAYSLQFSVSEVELDESLKQFLTGIHFVSERYLAAD